MTNTTYPTMDEIDGSILSDYVYHLVDSASTVPQGWAPLLINLNSNQQLVYGTALAYYNKSSGVYAEVYGKQQFDAHGNLIMDASGKSFLPSEIMVVYRGTVATTDPNKFF